MVKFSSGSLISIFVVDIPMEKPGHQTRASSERKMPLKVYLIHELMNPWMIFFGN